MTFAVKPQTRDWHPHQAALDLTPLRLLSDSGHQDLHPFMSYQVPVYPGAHSTQLYRGPRGEAVKTLDMPTLKAAAFITLCCAPGPMPTSSLPGAFTTTLPSC